MTVTNSAPAVMAVGADEAARSRHIRRQMHRSTDVDARQLSATERAIVDLDDEGFQAPSIARRLGVSAGEVRRVLGRYRGDPVDRLVVGRAAWGCDQLLRAHLASGQHDLDAPIAAALITAKGVRPAGQGSAAA